MCCSGPTTYSTGDPYRSSTRSTAARFLWVRRRRHISYAPDSLRPAQMQFGVAPRLEAEQRLLADGLRELDRPGRVEIIEVDVPQRANVWSGWRRGDPGVRAGA